ncbi:MAG TPA: TIGR01459 family HAD-type hydrolase, partial [Sulfitobacter pontiacus]|nr:TIGR01459 family HAD-type hydrolase [Sulfitobacter pontiacus]
MTQIINNLFEISDRYDALFVDLWGCVHDGVKALPDAVTALQAYRNGGGKVVLVTNSPRPRDGVIKQLAHFGVPDDAWDDIATSGDSARTAMYRGMVGTQVWHLGPPTDKHFFDPSDVLDDP